MYLFQHAYNDFYRCFYGGQEPIERRCDLVYLDDYVLVWLVFGEGIEACGGDFAVFMQAHSLFLSDLACDPQGTLLSEYTGYPTDDGTWIDDPGTRIVPHPSTAMGACTPRTLDGPRSEGNTPDWQNYTGLVHPAFLREWFDYLASFTPEARKGQWDEVWRARNDAVAQFL